MAGTNPKGTLIRGADGVLYQISPDGSAHSVEDAPKPSFTDETWSVAKRASSSPEHCSARVMIDPGDQASAQVMIEAGDHGAARVMIDPGDQASAQVMIEAGDHGAARVMIDPGDQASARVMIEAGDRGAI